MGKEGERADRSWLVGRQLSSHIPPPEHVVAPHLPPHHAACLPHYPFIIRQGHHFPGRNLSGHHSETMILIMMKSFLEGIGHPQLLGAYSWSGWLGSLRDGHGQINGRALCLFCHNRSNILGATPIRVRSGKV